MARVTGAVGRGGTEEVERVALTRVVEGARGRGEGFLERVQRREGLAQPGRLGGVGGPVELEQRPGD